MEEEAKKPIEIIVANRYVEEIIHSVNGIKRKYFDDLTQEVYLILLQYNQDKLAELISNNEIKYFISKIITNQYHSQTSPFWKKFRKFEHLCIDGDFNIETSELDDDKFNGKCNGIKYIE